MPKPNITPMHNEYVHWHNRAHYHDGMSALRTYQGISGPDVYKTPEAAAEREKHATLAELCRRMAAEIASFDATLGSVEVAYRHHTSNMECGVGKLPVSNQQPS